jgi:hypothetical protein
MILTLRIDLRKVIPARFVYKGALLAHFCLDFLDVIEIPGERGVYVGQRDGRNLENDIVRDKPLVLVPGDDVEHSDSVAGETSPAATDLRCLDDSFARDAVHD